MSPDAPTRTQWRDRLVVLTVRDRLDLLRANSGLPGPRANLTLLDAAADLADPAFVSAALGTGDEYLTACAAAGLCEPRLLRSPDAADRALRLCARATDTLLAQDPPTRRRPGWRTLRQALG